MIIIVLSMLCFIIGVLVFTFNTGNAKKEQEYAENFQFMISDHESKDDYFSIINQFRLFAYELEKRFYQMLSKVLHEEELYNTLSLGGFVTQGKIVKFYIYYLLEIFFFLFIIYLNFSDHMVKLLMIMSGFILINHILVKIIFQRVFVANEQRRIRASISYFLDLLASCTKSGMTIDQSLFVVAKYLEGMSVTLSTYIYEYGKDIANGGYQEAGVVLRDKIKLQEVQDFTAVLENAVETGAPITEALRILSHEIREFHFIETEEKIGRVNAKMGIPLILFIMFPIIVEIIAPGVLNLMEAIG